MQTLRILHALFLAAAGSIIYYGFNYLWFDQAISFDRAMVGALLTLFTLFVSGTVEALIEENRPRRRRN